MNRFTVVLLSTVVAVAAQWGCNGPTASSGPCETSATAFSAIPAAFVATVTKVDYEQGIAPGGSEISNYLLELTIPASANAAAGVFVKRGTPIFARSTSGVLTTATACAIEAGSRVEISHDDAISYSTGTPPNTWYYGTQLVIVR